MLVHATSSSPSAGARPGLVLKPGQTIEVAVTREGQEQKLTATVVER